MEEEGVKWAIKAIFVMMLFLCSHWKHLLMRVYVKRSSDIMS